ncbi:hypothetical protein [Streptomyces sp. TS71-3]|uniref:hypothetical protein n=1 Tax=Streptomyces sp. TS71-3 TaxID=2733862 RepID=UPI001B2B3FDE|nr:hypothetical protein [Streptomyces sp. TS71-3]GHJ38519.1 hypothetical protein Sm713_41280 [Streptomyces sp. TS71-3]
MWKYVESATGFPVILFTAALVIVLCFWLLAALRIVAVDSFDGDIDLEAWGMAGVPVSVAFSLFTVLAWGLGLGLTLLLSAWLPAGATAAVLRVVVSATALFAARRLTCLAVLPLRRVFSTDTVSRRPTAHDRSA